MEKRKEWERQYMERRRESERRAVKNRVALRALCGGTADACSLAYTESQYDRVQRRKRMEQMEKQKQDPSPVVGDEE